MHEPLTDHKTLAEQAVEFIGAVEEAEAVEFLAHVLNFAANKGLITLSDGITTQVTVECYGDCVVPPHPVGSSPGGDTVRGSAMAKFFAQ